MDQVKHSTRTIAIAAFAGLLVTYVETMITPALPILVTFFDTNYDKLSWVITAYIISGTISSAIFGRLADMYGKKRIFIVLAGVYSIAVSFGGFAKTLEELIIIRTVQGLGMGMFPVSFALINDQVPKNRLALAQGIVSSTFSGGAAIGLVLGAWITQNYGWQWSYHSSIPVALILLAVAAIYLHDESSRRKSTVDFIGVSMLAIALVSLILGLSEGEYWGWSSASIISLFALSLILVFAFVYLEQRSPEPFINLSLLKTRNVLLANIAGLFAMAGMFFLFYSVPPLLQDPEPAGFGVTIVESGLILLPAAVLNMVFAPLAAKLTTNRGPKTAIIVGLIILFFSYFGLYYNRSSIVAILEDASIMGMGISFIFVGIINILLVSVPREKAGESTGMNVVFRNIGTSLAPAIGGVFETMYVTYSLVGVVPGNFAGLGFIPIFSSFPSSAAYDSIYMVGMIFVVVALVLSMFMKNVVVGGVSDAL
ncbi:multidrug-efflux transporter [Thermoplasma volcanium GSS1]|uniref:Multidrug-efflux transporter n=1 Tax=Thermoplasma volcanium (strain ATCC 51530 / DSM 4299 / JCM 9571 / NBRC 15438 / GSS1) TaxID=273116 RepID=Q97BD9_THEVO|nr:MFS transporter [Thermoplasma volcanium]BAB59659.1 multidrug-efflux transporter [Thermoplasma volcanium GSS1]